MYLMLIYFSLFDVYTLQEVERAVQVLEDVKGVPDPVRDLRFFNRLFVVSL